MGAGKGVRGVVGTESEEAHVSASPTCDVCIHVRSATKSCVDIT